MPTETLTPERILEAAEDVLRRYGPAKANVVDVARALGVSHGSVYRHFPSKAALRDAVTERWLADISAPLAAVADEEGAAPERLQRWLDLLVAPNAQSARGARALRHLHRAHRRGARGRQSPRRHPARTAHRIIADGVARGEFDTPDPVAAARAVFDATTRYHNPVHAATWSDPDIDAAYENVRALVLAGLTPRHHRGA